ncbi:MAG: ssDNA-binding domain-containing protein [Duncaniella sp.]|uniref:ArdC family protein n=1 Tax=Duncaniella sp. TaxID=2518496 RepID=UPI0023CBC031|nr:ArdC-like ssDNA-binding domain-containing protein [Duncaniella sp.]MDE6089976.1 ssDNA-binding domain-containing protein [Duncaniella sp.]
MASGTNFSFPGKSEGAGQVALDRFAEMMIDRMEQMKDSDWKKGWIGGANGYAGLPQNVGGRNYSGSNSFFLQLQTAAKGYQLPVYLTFKQANNLKAHVLKGEKAFPVVYWDMMVKDKDGRKISSDEYKAMTKEERKNLDVIPFIKAFPVYNIEQTNLREVQPERVQKLIDKFKVPELRDTQGMYAHTALDRMIQQQSWLCPIQADRRENGAYYSPSRDIVVLPMKAQFNTGSTPEEIYRDGMEFYSTMLHEMTHSTMTPERLNREMGGKFGDPKYAKEELVAELTAAMISHSMGFDSRITDNSAAYLDSWISVLKKEPKFIVSIMADVNKASDLILDHVDKQRLALGEQPYLAKNDPWLPPDPNEEIPFKNAAILKTRSGDYMIRASYDGVDLGMKPIEKSTAKTYFQLTDMKDKESFLNMTARKHYQSEIAGIGKSVSKSLSL